MKSKIYEGFICSKIIPVSKQGKAISFCKILNVPKGSLVIVIDTDENLYIYNLNPANNTSSGSTPYLIYEFSLDPSEHDKRESLCKNYSFHILERELNDFCYEVNLFKYDNKVFKFILFSDLTGNFSCKLKKNPDLTFKIIPGENDAQFFEERKAIKKIIYLKEYTDSATFSINYDRYLSLFNLESLEEISQLKFNSDQSITSHNLNIFKHDVYISVLTLDEGAGLNFWLYSMPDLKMSFNFKLSVDFK
jgi:hypothetical protein